MGPVWTFIAHRSGCRNQLPDPDGLNSANELTPSLVLWGSRWNLLQMLQFGALRKSVLAAPCRDVRAIASRALIRSGESEAGSA
jgi:hypothetical protein